MTISSFIYDWLKNIVLILILLSMFNMIMPSGNMKRYMEHITGLIIIFTIISPLLNIVKMDFSLEREVFNSLYNNNPIQEDEVLEVYNREVETLYYKKVEEEITDLIKEKSHYKVLDIDMMIHKEGNEYGLLKSIRIRVDDQESNVGNSKKIQVKKIKAYEEKIHDSRELELEPELKVEIAEKLGINKELIYIYIKN